MTLQTIFQDAFPAYEQTPPLPPHVRTAAPAIRQCRTAALGGHIQACPDGHVARLWDNSCRPRACPQCASLQTERWLGLQQARLLACDHAHGRFPLPHALTPRWLANVSVMTTLGCQAVHDTLRTFLAAPTDLGAPPGSRAALHTWSQPLRLQPQGHGLVTGGGRTAAGQWKAVRHGCLLPVRVVMVGFRGKRLAALRQALARAELGLPEGMQPPQLRNLLQRLGHPRKTKWKVPSRERSRHGAGVVRYLTRSVRGGPIHNARLVAWDGERVTCPCRPRQEAADGGRPSPQRRTWAVAALLQRWLLPVPGPPTRVVRASGLYHPTQADALASCRAHVGQPPVAAPVAVDWQPVWAQRGDQPPECCPTCGPCLVCPGVISRGGAPPPVLAGEGAAGGRHTTGGWGRAARGVGRLAVAQWCPGAGRDAVWGAHRARAADCCPTGEAVRACGRREGVGVPRPQLPSASAYAMSGRIRTRSVQPRALRSAQGRAGVYRQALSPEHSR